MNILVTGANGQLGHEMQICAKNSNHKFVFTDVAEGYEKLDITNLDAIREKVKENDIQVIVNCAAYTNVDKAESDFDLANLLNNTAAGNLAQAMKEVDGTLIHVSTDYVFQGDKNIPCKEDWETNPLGVYGKTKLAGEKSIEATGCKHIIIRTAWLYSQWGKNFVKTMQSLTASHDTLRWYSTRWVLLLTLATWLPSSLTSSRPTSSTRPVSTTFLTRVYVPGSTLLRLSANSAAIPAISSLATARSSQAQ